MKQFKLTLVLTVLMSMVGLQAFAAWDTSTKVEVDGLYYYLDNDNLQAQVTFKPSGKYMGKIEIPFDFIYAGNIYSVTSIGDYAFAYCSDLSSVTIGNSVTSIGSYAFFYCYGLTSVIIPNSVTSIGDEAFSGCSGLTSIIVELGNTIYDSRNNCNAIIETANNTLIAGCKNTTIPSSVTSIGNYAFYGCSALTSVTIPNSVTSIGAFAYGLCSALTSVTLNSNDIVSKEHTYSDNIKTIFGNQVKKYVIGDDVTSIGDNAFYGCTGITSVTIGNNVTSIGYMTFYGCTGLTSITIPDKVTTIGAYAFRDCSGLESVTIGSGVTSYGNSAFQCSNLTSVTALNPTPVAITQNVFTNRTNATLYVPKGSKSAYKAAYYWKEFKGIFDRIEFADANVKAICIAHWDTNGDGILSDNEAAAVTTVSDFFKGNTSITSFDEFANFTGVTSIGQEAFSHCSGLTSITIPSSVTSIGYSAFSYCSGLTSIIVESGNAKYDSRNNCNAIIETASNTLVAGCKNTTIPNSVTSIGVGAFEGCSGLTSITIPNSVTSIGNSAFWNCSGLTSVTIPNSVTSIGDYAFFGCDGLKKVIVKDIATWCGIRFSDNPLYYAHHLYSDENTEITNLIIPNSVTSIGDRAFSYCYGLTSVTIGNSVTSIGDYAFDSCSGLESVTIGSGVTSYGNSAFQCSNLTSVTALNPTPVAIAYYVFTNRWNATLYVPKGSKDAYKAAAYWKQFKEIIEIETTGIDQISFQENGEQGIDQEGAVWYTIDGKQMDKPKKGINIIRMKNGTTKKVVVK